MWLISAPDKKSCANIMDSIEGRSRERRRATHTGTDLAYYDATTSYRQDNVSPQDPLCTESGSSGILHLY